MKLTRKCLILLTGLAAALLPSCAITDGGGSLTFGYTGQDQLGNAYVIGLNVPLGRKKPVVPVITEEPPLPVDGSGKTPVQVQP